VERPAAERAGRAAAMLAALGLSACASGAGHPPAAYRTGALRPYEIGGHRYEPRVVSHYEEKGLASWYSYPAGTRRTASGEWFDARELTAAHKTLPLPCMAEVTNLENGRSIKVRVNDRGPFVHGRIIDLSRAAADRLGFAGRGLAEVRVKFLGPAPMADSGELRLAAVDRAGPAADDMQLY
jgi:rare lipoprotein A